MAAPLAVAPEGGRKEDRLRESPKRAREYLEEPIAGWVGGGFGGFLGVRWVDFFLEVVVEVVGDGGWFCLEDASLDQLRRRRRRRELHSRFGRPGTEICYILSICAIYARFLLKRILVL